MTRQVSFSKLEKDLRPKLREKMNAAESTEDLKKFFAQTVGELLERVLGDNANFGTRTYDLILVENMVIL